MYYVIIMVLDFLVYHRVVVLILMLLDFIVYHWDVQYIDRVVWYLDVDSSHSIIEFDLWSLLDLQDYDCP